MIDETKIMQLADGTLPLEEREEVKKAIEADPKLKELYNSYQETGDLLFKLGNEIKSQPLPNSLKEKLKVLNEAQEKVIKIKKPFAFFNIFKVQYAGIAATLALFFFGGFYTQEVMMAKKTSDVSGLQVVKKKTEKTIIKSNEDLSTRITNVYKFFNEKEFVEEFNNVIVDLKAGDEFNLSLKDASGTLIKFILVKVYQSNEGSQCANIAFNKKTLLSRSDPGTNLKLDLCKKEDRYELVSINLSK
jgi:hypothetical protein